jgi:hypothetical protein
VLFISGGASNQRKFHAQFDHIVLLTVSVPLDEVVGKISAATTP